MISQLALRCPRPSGPLLTILFALLISPATTTAQSPELVADLNPNIGDANLFPQGVTPLGAVSLFSGITPGLGRELWVSDGTAIGTELLFDIAPGFANGISNDTFDPIELNGQLIFGAGDSSTGYGLWITDGTSTGTVEVLLFESRPQMLGRLGNQVLFCADDGTHGAELWSSDGTEPGTILVRDVAPGSVDGCFSFNGGGVAGNMLFFDGANTNGRELWVTDGTQQGTVEVEDLNAGPGDSTPFSFVPFGNGVAFTAYDGTQNVLWFSDGTAFGTAKIPTTGTSPIARFVFDGDLFFYASESGAGRGLFKTDGTTSTRLQDSTGTDFTYHPSGGMAILGSNFFFSGEVGSTGIELWRSDGTSAGTGLFEDIEPGLLDSAPWGITRIGNRIFFSAKTSSNGREPWVTNGTTTQMIDDLDGTSADSFSPSSVDAFFEPAGSTDVALFQALTQQGYELWSSDGTAQGTQRLTDVVSHESSRPEQFQSMDSGVAFVYTHVQGIGLNQDQHRLAHSDGTVSGTGELSALNADINSVIATGRAGSSVVAFVEDDAAGTIDLWRSLVNSIAVPEVMSHHSHLRRARSANGRLVWQISGGAIYSSTGGQVGDVAAAEVVDFCGFTGSFELVADLLFFSDETDCRPWLLNLQTGVTFELSDMESSADPIGPVPEFFAVTGSRALFFGTRGAAKGQLWSSDGTIAGTLALPLTVDATFANVLDLQDLRGGPGPSGHFFLVEVGGEEQVWRSDGSAAGTVQVFQPPAEEEIQFPAVRSAEPATGIFMHGASGLWFSGGSPATTELILTAESLPGLEVVASHGDTLVVTASRPKPGRELAAVFRTGAVAWLGEIEPGARGTNVEDAIAHGEELFFAAYRSDVGTELFKLDLSDLFSFADGFEGGDVAAWQ